MAMRLLGMKEYDRIMEELRKENCDLKLRIYFLQDGWKEKFGCNSTEIQTQMEEMKRIIRDKEIEILGKDELLSERKSQMKQMINRLKIEQARNETLQQDMLHLKKQLSENESLISTLRHELNMYEQLKTKTNVAGISMLPHVGDDDSSPTDISMLPHVGDDDSSPTDISMLPHVGDDDSSPTDISMLPHVNDDDSSPTDISMLPHVGDDDSSPTDISMLPHVNDDDSSPTDISMLPHVGDDDSSPTDISMLPHVGDDDSSPTDISMLPHVGDDDSSPTDISMLPHVGDDDSSPTDISMLPQVNGDDDSSPTDISMLPHVGDDYSSPTDISILPHVGDDDSSPTDISMLPHVGDDDSSPTDISMLPQVNGDDDSSPTDISMLPHVGDDDSSPTDISMLPHVGDDDSTPTDISMLPHVGDDYSSPTDISMLPHVDGDDSSPTETMGSGRNLHSKSNQDEQPFNEIDRYQTACSPPTSSQSLKLFLQNERSCLGGDSISLSEPKRGNSAPEITSSLSGFKDVPFQINSELQQLLEVKTKENILLRSKLGLLDHTDAIDPTFLPDVTQLKKEAGDLKSELNKSRETIQKQKISINVQCKEIKRMRRERNACLCGIFGASREHTSNAWDNKNFGIHHHHNHHQRRKSRNEESLSKNQTVKNADDATDFDQQVKYLSDKSIDTDLLISQQSKNFKNPLSYMNFTPSIYGGHRFTFDSETEPNIQCQKVVCAKNSDCPKSDIVKSKNQYQRDLGINNSLQAELAIDESEEQKQISTTLNKEHCSSHLAAGLSPMLAPQSPSSKMTNRTKSSNNNLSNTFSHLSSRLHPSENSGLNDNISEVTTLLKQEALMYALSCLPIW